MRLALTSNLLELSCALVPAQQVFFQPPRKSEDQQYHRQVERVAPSVICVRGWSVATTTTFCAYIGDISGFTRRVTGSARIAFLRAVGLHLASCSVAGGSRMSFLS